ncbi:glycosyltransferase family 4 protein [Bacteroides thetaiotaomicron]|nr:glycosyltransferase family 4 protein [Bacteroides thetaiotaomicron]
MIEKNVVILRIETGNPSGVVRYIQMLTEGMKHMNGIKVHIICLNTSLIFPKFEVTEDRIIANIPYPSKSKPLRNEIYWLTKYFNVVSDLISPYFKNRKQLIWHVQELLLVKLADILKLSLGGHILTHLHIIPWKLSLEYNESLFKKQYSQWLNNTFNLINENQLEKIAYPLSDRIICVSYSAMKHIISAYGIHPDKISVIYNGMDDTGITLQERKSRTPEILFVGRISREKGVICLLNALNKVASRGYFCKLKLVGQCTGYMSSHIRKAYKQLKIDILGTVSFNELKRTIYNKYYRSHSFFT